jgi:hypothetical protein
MPPDVRGLAKCRLMSKDISMKVYPKSIRNSKPGLKPSSDMQPSIYSEAGISPNSMFGAF